MDVKDLKETTTYPKRRKQKLGDGGLATVNDVDAGS